MNESDFSQFENRRLAAERAAGRREAIAEIVANLRTRAKIEPDTFSELAKILTPQALLVMKTAMLRDLSIATWLEGGCVGDP